MNIQRFWKKFAVAFMALVLLLPCLAIPAFAYNPIDTSRETSLTVHFGEGSTDFFRRGIPDLPGGRCI